MLRLCCGGGQVFGRVKPVRRLCGVADTQRFAPATPCDNHICVLFVVRICTEHERSSWLMMDFILGGKLSNLCKRTKSTENIFVVRCMRRVRSRFSIYMKLPSSLALKLKSCVCICTAAPGSIYLYYMAHQSPYSRRSATGSTNHTEHPPHKCVNWFAFGSNANNLQSGSRIPFKCTCRLYSTMRALRLSLSWLHCVSICHKAWRSATTKTIRRELASAPKRIVDCDA